MSEFVTPSLLITEYYDSLISQIDIFTEERIRECKDDIDEEECGEKYDPSYFDNYGNVYGVETIYNPYKPQKYSINRTDISETEITDKAKAVEYMNKVRQKAIEEIRKVQDENLEYYKANKDKLKVDRKNLTEEKLEELKSQLFANRFCFLVKKEPYYLFFDSGDNKDIKNPLFYLHTVITDFYVRESDIVYIKFENFKYLSQSEVLFLNDYFNK